MLRFFLFLVCSVTFESLFVNAQEDTSMFESRAKDCRKLLESSIVDFYLPACVDQEHGGYFEVLDDQGKFVGSDKFLTMQARQLWFFSTLAVHDIRREESLKAAQAGYRFLKEKMLDKELGGYFAKTSSDGKIVDARKHVYPNAFVIYGFVEYYRASGDEAALQDALALFETLDERCYDEQSGGYNEFFHADWSPVDDPSESGYIGAINTKTYNSHLHLLEAFAQLYRESEHPVVAERLRELVLINVSTVRHPSYACNIDGWTPSWQMIETPRNLRHSFGHDVECAWLVLDAVAALGASQDLHLKWAKGLCDSAIKTGYDHAHGGFFYTGPLGEQSDDRKKEWWTQSEALVAMLTMYQRTGDGRYWAIFEETFQFVDRHQIADEGGWYATLEEDGSLGDRRSRTSMWQGAYHNGRALLLCEQLLGQLAERVSPVGE